MNLVNKLKKITILVLTAILFTTLIGFSGAKIEAQAATNEVSMYYVDKTTTNYRGYTSMNIYIKVKNLGSNKNVIVHYNGGVSTSNLWVDKQATYVKTLTDGSQIYRCDSIGGFGITYAIKYTVNGATYWDSNDGKNYTTSNTLGVNPIKNKRINYNESINYANYPIKVQLRNLAYAKDVKVKYTQDNGITYTTKALTYQSVAYDNSNDEDWGTTLNLNPSKIGGFKYQVSYTVNGQTYYDDNFGFGYTNKFYSPM